MQHDTLYCVFPRHLSIGRSFIFERVRRKRIFFYDKGKGRRCFFRTCVTVIDLLIEFVFAFRCDDVGDAHGIEQGERHFALFYMLGLVVDGRHTPPSDEEDERHGIDVAVREG